MLPYIWACCGELFYAFNMWIASSSDNQNAKRKQNSKIKKYILVVKKLNLNFT